MAKVEKFAVRTLIVVLCAVLGLSFVSCSGSDVDGDRKQAPITPEVSSSVDNTYVNHNWVETEKSFVDSVTSVTEYTELNQKKTLRVKLPATINWTVKEVLRASKTFEAGEISLGEEVKDLYDDLSRKDTTVYRHDRSLTETFAETAIEMNTCWLNGKVLLLGEESELAYVTVDSIKAMPEKTTVKFIEWADEANKIERDSFLMPHKAYYTEYSVSGKKNFNKDFMVSGTFLYQQEGDEPVDPTPEPDPTPEEIQDAKFISRWFDNATMISYQKIHCIFNSGREVDSTFYVKMPYAWSFPAEWSKHVSSEGPSKFVKLSPDANPSATEFKLVSKDECNGEIHRRKVSSETTFKFTDFDEVLSSYHHEAYLVILGKDYQFLSPSESIAQGNHGQDTTESNNVSTEKNTVKAEITFNKELFHASGVVNVIREIKDTPVDPTPEPDPEPTPDPDPTPDDNTIPSEWGEITGVIGVTRIVETINNKDYWHTCLALKTTKGRIQVIDKKWKTVTNAFMSFNEVYDDSRMISGAYKDGIVYPALVSIDAAGWTYVSETKTGINFAVDMTDQRAVTGGIKNFTKNNTAKPTPIVQNDGGKFSYKDGKKILTVTCMNVDDKVTDVFVINCIPSAE